MGDEHADRIKRYRDYAEELRAMSQSWTNAETLQKLLALADDYDRMAERVEPVEQDHR